MPQPPTPPEFAEERLGVSLYEPDIAALNALVIQLKQAGVKTSGRVAVKILVHSTPEDDLFGFALSRARSMEASKVKGEETIADHYGFPIFIPDVDKLDRVNDRLDLANAKGGRSFIIRARLHAPIDYPALAKAVTSVLKKKPDGRSKAGRKLAGRD